MSQVADTGRLVVDSSASTGSALAEAGPTVEVAGQSHAATWRTWTIDLPPGHYQVRISAGGREPADLVATVHAGQDTTIHYRAADDAVELRHTPKPARSDIKLYLNMAFGATIVVILLVVLVLDIWG